MPGAFGDLIVQNTSTTGTGSPLTLTTAVFPYMTAAQSGMQDGQTVHYSIVDLLGGNSESCEGVLSNGQTQLTRITIVSTNSNAPINIQAGQVLITPMQRDMVALNQFVHACFGIR